MSELSYQNFDLGPALKRSVIIHVIIVVTVIASNLIFTPSKKAYIPTLRVDLVALPDVLKSEVKNPKLDAVSKVLDEVDHQQQKAQAEKSLKSEPLADPNEMLIKPKKKAETSHVIANKNRHALDRIKALAKLGNDAPQKTDEEATVVKGNMLSPGSSVSGEAKEASAASYYDTLRDRLQDNWTLPAWVARLPLDAQIKIYLDHQGRLKSFKFIKPSGNEQFDDAIKRALEESQPFPPPPEALKTMLSNEGVLIGFPL